VEDIGAVDVQQRLKLHLGAIGIGQTLDEQGLALLDAVLLPAGLDDCVHVQSELDAGAADSALAPERRRPPLRPRRRGLDSTASIASSAASASAGTSTSEALAEVRPTSSIRTRCFSPT